MEKKGKKKKLIGKILIVILILFIILIILLLIQYKKLDLSILTRKPQLFIIKDECSLILGNIIHKIKNGDECKIFCRNECILRKIEFYNSEFIESNNSCHTC